ncbi:hypothetical protein IMZ48_49140, partial [Candidatus Bathyarchaeota archaeon]|nr:hypothetical protein [Candidatus Bathyarchaeota archaeon]
MSTLRATFLFALLSLGLTHPLDARSPDPPVPGIVPPPGSQIFPCTSTLNMSLPSCATSPPHAYAATKMLYREVDCAGCLAVSLRTTRDNPCPAQTEAPLETVDGTTTEWETVCSPTSMLPLNYPRDGLRPRQIASTTRPSCPTTLMIPVENTGA